MKLINADTLLENFKDRAPDSMVPLSVVINIIRSAPDAQVRCKDCENYDTSWMPVGTHGEVYWCSLIDCRMEPEEYCSGAKRKEITLED